MRHDHTADPSRWIDTQWDVIVIGTGVGGATAGHALAAGGKRVLFCERGRQGSVVGAYPEQHERAPTPEILRTSGRYSDEIVDQSRAKVRRFIPFIGAGRGGSSALYGMAFERFAATDFEPGRWHRNATGSSIVDAWPVTYASFAPYYARAEALFRVRGTRDTLSSGHGQLPPLLAPPPMTSANAGVVDFLESRGMHPYRLPMACEFVPGCECCQGFICPKACKNDSQRICLSPAVEQHGAEVIEDCAVLRLESEGTRVKGLVCRWRGRTLLLKGDTIVLGAGALQTPALLMRSATEKHPDGLANRSGLVGRNLMRHFIDLYLIRPEKGSPAPLDNRFKEWAFNDFYQVDDTKLGSVQSFGRMPTPHMLYESLKDDVRHGPAPVLAHLLPLAAPALRKVLSGLVDGTVAMASTLEDLPYADNRVLLDGVQEPSAGAAALRLNYTVKPYDAARIAHMRRSMLSLLAPRRPRLIEQAENNQRIAHVCGTCRFGDDPLTSVLNRNNRAHDLENLFVVDSSFFPSSGGTNPSLTIAANALRVADVLLGRPAAAQGVAHDGARHETG